MAQTRWLNDHEQHAWRAFLEATRRLEEQLDRELQQEAGLPLTYYTILAMLSEAPARTLRMSELAQQTWSSRSRLSHAVDRLEEKGWIERISCPSDKRGAFAMLTDAGFAVLEAAAPGHVAGVRRHVFDQLTPSQVEALGLISETVAQRLGESAACTGCHPEPAQDPYSSRRDNGSFVVPPQDDMGL